MALTYLRYNLRFDLPINKVNKLLINVGELRVTIINRALEIIIRSIVNGLIRESLIKIIKIKTVSDFRYVRGIDLFLI
jgi:hypothetical protein